jgi:UDP-glucose 4-epimerase
MAVPNTWLITGGAGYIGAHIADAFLNEGKRVIVYDSLYRGLESRVDYLRNKYNKEIPLIVADIRDKNSLTTAIQKYKPEGVIHVAALKSVAESMDNPSDYFEVNHDATKSLIEVVSSNGVHHLIFSSTAAVYGMPNHSYPVKEDNPKNPISPYGASKLAAENEVNLFLEGPGNFGTSLRFFNVAGAAAQELLDNSVENLIPIVIGKLKSGQAPSIYGTDYATPDGTCIRDYVDVRDVARAHLMAAESISVLPLSMNIGTGHGASVREVIQLLCTSLNQKEIKAIELGRRAGDCDSLIADVSLIRSALDFETNFSLKDSIGALFSEF